MPADNIENTNNPLTVHLKGMNFDNLSLDDHRKHPEVTLDQYHRTKVLETGDRVLCRKAIYLDTRYWIKLRDAYMGRSSDPTITKLLETLRSVVRDGKAICPFAADIFAEVMQQSADCRTVTANLIDELSQGIALQPEHERVATEILYCFRQAQRGVEALEPLSRLVWASSSYVLGFNIPSLAALAPEDELALQKAFTDHMWNLGFSHQVASFGDLPESLKSGHNALADKLNILNDAHCENLRSFKQVHLAEFSGILECYLPEITGVLPYLYEQKYGAPSPTNQSSEIERSGRQLAAILQESFRRNKLGSHLPTLVIRSGLAAAVRWNRRRKYEANDFHDFGHAAAALPYFDFFATEKSLHHLVTTELKYSRKYDTTVQYDPSQFLAVLAGM